MTTVTLVWSEFARHFRGKHSLNLHAENFDAGCVKISPPPTPPIKATLHQTLDPVTIDVTSVLSTP